jgi:TP901 family phage tail tape measure protein
MAGFRTESAIAALPGVVDLATVAQVDLARATDIASDSIGALGLATDDAAQLGINLARVNDVIAKTTVTANTNIEDMFEAIKAGGPQAVAAGQSVETFAAMVGQLANAGIKGSEAGTGLRNFMLRLSAPTAAARTQLRRLNVSVDDGHGNFRDMNDVIRDLGTGLSRLTPIQRTQALATIFGQKVVTTANNLLSIGADKLDEYRAQLEGATGAAGDMATMMRDTTQGDMNSFNSAVEAVQIEVFEAIREPLRDIVQATTEWVRANKDVIASGITDTMAWLKENLPEIQKWARRLGIAFLAFATILIASAALVSAPFILLSALFYGVIVLLFEAWEWISRVGPGIAKSISDAVTGMWESVTGFFQAGVEFIVGLFVLLREAAMPILRPLFNFIGGAARWIMDRFRPLGEFFSGLWDGIGALFVSATGAVTDEASSLFDSITEIFAPLAEWFSGLWDGIVAGFREAMGWVLEKIGQAASFFNATRAVGRGEIEGGADPQVISPQERVARSITETTTTSRGEVTIRDETGRAEVTRRPRREAGGLRLQRSGVM